MDTPMDPESNLVIVIHGYCSHRLIMAPMCWRLRRRGYRVENWGYHSLFRSIDTHAKRLHRDLNDRWSSEPRVCIIAHSMGSIVTRKAIDLGPPPNLDRVVLLAPPNRGIVFARVLSLGFGWLSRSLAQISSHSCSYVNQLPQELPVDVGVVAGTWDLLVPISKTRLEKEKDRIVIRATHNSVLFSGYVCQLVDRFLRQGKF